MPMMLTVAFCKGKFTSDLSDYQHLLAQEKAAAMEQRTLKKVNNCLNTNIYSYLETSGGKSFNPYLNVVHVFNTSVNQTSMAQDSCFPALVSNMQCSLVTVGCTFLAFLWHCNTE